MANIMETPTYDFDALQEKATSILLEELRKQETLDIDSVITTFIGNKFDSPERLAKELVWELVEKGEVRFNDDWLLELNS
jgi:hypothetical protein